MVDLRVVTPYVLVGGWNVPPPFSESEAIVLPLILFHLWNKGDHSYKILKLMFPQDPLKHGLILTCCVVTVYT